MAQIPLLSGREVVRIFERFGWQIARPRGSHIILVKEEARATLSVPDHKESLEELFAASFAPLA